MGVADSEIVMGGCSEVGRKFCNAYMIGSGLKVRITDIKILSSGGGMALILVLETEKQVVWAKHVITVSERR